MASSLARGPDGEIEGSPGTPVAAHRARAMIALSFAAILGAAVWVSFTEFRPRPGGPVRGVRLLGLDRPFPAGGRYPSDPYVGPRACEECHPGEYALYTRSGHARTLRSSGRRSIARRLDGITIADPELSDVSWNYQYRDGDLFIRRKARSKVEECVAEYAFGSGHHGVTFVSVIDPAIPAILEHRISYYAHQDALGLTAGQDVRPRPNNLRPLGRLPDATDGRKCFGCHSTQLSARDDGRIDENTLIPNVSCERCHGPGRAHVEAARRGASGDELQLPFGPGRFTADSLHMLCGTCHRHPSQSQPEQIRPDDPHLVRFQPVGIMQSRCFRESAGAFSCVNCHDPHARASTDRAAYLSVCLSCHGGTAPADRPTAHGSPCPVAPSGDCIDCHMPRVDAGQHIMFTDHWIRVRREGEPMLPLKSDPDPTLRPLDAAEP